MTEQNEKQPEGEGTVSVPVDVTMSVFTVITLIGKLDMVIAIELDAGRPALAREIATIRNDLAEMAKIERWLKRSPADRPADPEASS